MNNLIKVLNTKYFLCAKLECTEIKRNNYMFCDKHTIYNVSRLKEKPIQVDEKDIEKILLKEMSDNIIINI